MIPTLRHRLTRSLALVLKLAAGPFTSPSLHAQAVEASSDLIIAPAKAAECPKDSAAGRR